MAENKKTLTQLKKDKLENRNPKLLKGRVKATKKHLETYIRTDEVAKYKKDGWSVESKTFDGVAVSTPKSTEEK